MLSVSIGTIICIRDAVQIFCSNTKTDCFCKGQWATLVCSNAPELAVQLLFLLVKSLAETWGKFSLITQVTLLTGLTKNGTVNQAHDFQFLEKVSLGCKLQTVTLDSREVVLFPRFGFKQLQTSQEFLQKIKGWATELGLDPKHYASHSNKVGSIYMADAACMPNSLTIVMGRWRSDKMLGVYIEAVRSMRELTGGLKELWPRLALIHR
jgi:hypothetical protein